MKKKLKTLGIRTYYEEKIFREDCFFSVFLNRLNRLNTVEQQTNSCTIQAFLDDASILQPLTDSEFEQQRGGSWAHSF